MNVLFHKDGLKIREGLYALVEGIIADAKTCNLDELPEIKTYYESIRTVAKDYIGMDYSLFDPEYNSVIKSRENKQ